MQCFLCKRLFFFSFEVRDSEKHCSMSCQGSTPYYWVTLAKSCKQIETQKVSGRKWILELKTQRVISRF